MKRKYYLRGLGFGVLITSVVFILAGQQKEISEEEVIRRAEALGYVRIEADTETGTTPSIDLDKLLSKENTVTPVPTEAVLIGETPIPTEKPIVTPTLEPSAEVTLVPTVTNQPESTMTPTLTPETEITPEPTDAALATPLPTEAGTPAPSDGTKQVVTAEITVVAGVYSGEVCQLLEDAGIVEDGQDFRWYLAKNGFDREVVHGTYTLSSDMTYEELARILTRNSQNRQNNQKNPDSQNATDAPENSENPDSQNTTDAPENSENPDNQNTTDAPENPENPDNQNTMDVQENPANPDSQNTSNN